MANKNQPTSTTVPSTNDHDKAIARGLLVEEIKHRRDKEWKIFAFATSVLLAIIEAVVAISARPGSVNLATRHKVILVLTLLVLTVAAGLWLWRNLNTEEKSLSSSRKIPGASNYFQAAVCSIV
jgi:hypothetical protein